MLKKIRLDRLLIERGLVESREKARAFILEGNVLVNGMRVDKAGAMVMADAPLEILQEIPYVSRGGLKLEEAIRSFRINIEDKTAMDVGASTGGFTDCLLQHRARKVYAIDVGYGQFAWSLRHNPKVVLLEKTNIRYLEKELIKDAIDIATIDVSFISILKVIPKVLEFLTPCGEIIALIKPQFEAGRESVGKGGVVRDEAKRLEVVEKIKIKAQELGLNVIGIVQSPLPGPKGNIEYFVYLKKTANPSRTPGCESIRNKERLQVFSRGLK
ncbi:MAG TPA: TlyA family rRNA (cytidine-2'-O)-methyltransferase, partial [Nitrospiraceae bacterium]|nr:TlyA family rRNA (cytidine-2'-O)-methyltransferase [Nitrospiraceae bacterium]